MNESNDMGEIVLDFTGVPTGAVVTFAAQVDRMEGMMQSGPAKAFFLALGDLARGELRRRETGGAAKPTMIKVPAEVATFAGHLSAGMRAAFPGGAEEPEVL